MLQDVSTNDEINALADISNGGNSFYPLNRFLVALFDNISCACQLQRNELPGITTNVSKNEVFFVGRKMGTQKTQQPLFS